MKRSLSPIRFVDVLLRHPAVTEALAFAVLHKSLGEDIYAVVAVKSKVSAKDLKIHCAKMLSCNQQKRV
jgi:acyl-coenzyme A synthetase/AMP-(fatty) acid ligase